jgi:hypothetical protein
LSWFSSTKLACGQLEISSDYPYQKATRQKMDSLTDAEITPLEEKDWKKKGKRKTIME